MRIEYSFDKLEMRRMSGVGVGGAPDPDGHGDLIGSEVDGSGNLRDNFGDGDGGEIRNSPRLVFHSFGITQPCEAALLIGAMA